MKVTRQQAADMAQFARETCASLNIQLPPNMTDAALMAFVLQLNKTRHPFGEGANKAGRELVAKMEKDLQSQKEFADNMKSELGKRGVSKEWMKKHLVITKI